MHCQYSNVVRQMPPVIIREQRKKENGNQTLTRRVTIYVGVFSHNKLFLNKHFQRKQLIRPSVNFW